MRSFFLSLLIILTCLSTFAQDTPSKFSRTAVLADLEFLYQSLQEAHYDLYAYTPKQRMDAVYDSIKGSIQKDSMNLLEVTNVLQPLTSAVNNGHTAIEFPIPLYISYAYGGGTVFPLEVAMEKGKALVRKNWSVNDSISPGMELLSINGVAIDDVLAKIYLHISAERRYLKQAKLELFTLPRYYWQVFGEVDHFEVEVRSNGSTTKVHLAAVKALDDYEMKRDDIIDPSRKLQYLEDVAWLKPGNFSGDEPQYQRFIDSAFTDIREKNTQKLIIDIRNNSGGDNSFSDYLVSYLAREPFRWYGDFSLKTSNFLKAHIRKEKDTANAFWRSALDHENGAVYTYDFEPYQPQPEENRFHGEVYLLINRQSHSQAAVTAAQIQDYELATLVGEETGDFPSLYASIYAYQLPKTGILVNVSKGRIIRVNGSTKKEGVIPDILIKDHLLDEEDEILQTLLKRL